MKAIQINYASVGSSREERYVVEIVSVELMAKKSFSLHDFINCFLSESLQSRTVLDVFSSIPFLCL